MNQFLDSTDEMYTIHRLSGQVHSETVHRMLCPLYIRYIFVLSVIHPLLIWQRLLVTVLCPLLVRYICVAHAFYALLTRSSSSPRWLSLLDEHQIIGRRLLAMLVLFWIQA